jgi:hypothetical protein
VIGRGDRPPVHTLKLSLTSPPNSPGIHAQALHGIVQAVIKIVHFVTRNDMPSTIYAQQRLGDEISASL